VAPWLRLSGIQPAEADYQVECEQSACGVDKVYMRTSDVHVVALDVKTGRVVWDEPLTEERGFTLTGGPLVAKGKVMIGTGGRVGGKNYIVALDAGTGKLAWRRGAPGGHDFR